MSRCAAGVRGSTVHGWSSDRKLRQRTPIGKFTAESMRLPSRTWTSRPGRLLCVVALALLVGCAGTSKRDVLESRLRHQEDMLSRYQSQLDRAKTELDIARRESAGLRTQLAESGDGRTPREEMDASFRMAGVAFSTLMTGATETDDQPGDDGLTIVLVPQDADGELVKVRGAVEIEAFDLSHPDGAQRIGHWQFDAGESHQHWHSGVIQSGYQFELPWQDLPRSEKVLLHGRIVAADGRQFDTTHTIRIDPPGAALTERGSPTERGGRIEPVAAVSDDNSGWPTGAKSRGAEPREAETANFDGETGGSHSAESNVPPQAAWSEATPPLFGHASADRRRTKPDAKSLRGNEFADRRGESEPPRMEWTAPPTVGRTAEGRTVGGRTAPPLPTESHSSTMEHHSHSSDTSPRAAFDAEVPPPILGLAEDADSPDDDSWYRKAERPAAGPVRTSDSWTDETIPRLR